MFQKEYKVKITCQDVFVYFRVELPKGAPVVVKVILTLYRIDHSYSPYEIL